MDLGILLAFLSMIVWGASEFFTKIALGKAPSSHLIVVSELIGFGLVLVPVLIFSKIPPISGIALLVIIIIGLMNAAALYAWYYSVHHKGVSLTSPIVNSWAIITVPLGILFFGERLSFVQLLAAIIIIVGIFILLVKDVRSIHIDQKLMFTVLSMVLWGVFFFLLKIPTDIVGPLVVFLGVRAISGAVFLPSLRTWKGEGLWPMVVVGILNSAGFLFYLYAVQHTQISIAAPIIAAAPLVAVLLGLLLLKERLSHRQQWGVFVTIIGAVLITF